MNNLSTKLAALLTAAFVAFTAVLILATQAMFQPEQLQSLSAYVVIASVAYALLAAGCAHHLCTRRLTQLAEAVDTFQVGRFEVPLQLAGANPRGDEIDRLAAHVESMTSRITSQLSQLELLAARRRDLLANVSHDLRTPLASMQGYLEILLLRHGGLTPAEERNYLEVAAKHSERLGQLVGDLFELTKLEADEVRPQCETFPLAELVQDVAQKFALDAAQRQLELHAACGATLPMVHADIGMVERVLENLVENALRHTPAGGTVTLALAQAGARVTVAVRDTGVGIAPEDIEGVFERYYRADRTAAGSHAGLGLAISRRMVQLHGGELVVHSRLGQGTTFSFDLPLLATAPMPSTAALAPPALRAHSLGR